MLVMKWLNENSVCENNQQASRQQHSVLVFLLQLFCVVWVYSYELREKKKNFCNIILSPFYIWMKRKLSSTEVSVVKKNFFFNTLPLRQKKIVGLSQSMYIVTVCWTVGILFFGCLLVTLYSPYSKTIVMIYSSYEICILFIVISCYSHDNATMIFYSQVMLLNILQLRKMWGVGFNEICCYFENLWYWCFTEEY